MNGRIAMEDVVDISDFLMKDESAIFTTDVDTFKGTNT
jgi:hypothetical protein